MDVLAVVKKNFWDNGPFYEESPKFLVLQVESTADTVGKVAAGVLAGGIAVHAIAANISKRKELMKRINKVIKQMKKI